MIAFVIDQLIGMGLVGLFAGFVIADVTRPIARRRAGAEDPAKLKSGERASESQ